MPWAPQLQLPLRPIKVTCDTFPARVVCAPNPASGNHPSRETLVTSGKAVKMRALRSWLLAILLVTFTAGGVAGATPAGSHPDMATYSMVILLSGPAFSTAPTAGGLVAMRQHRAFVDDLVASGKCLLLGSITSVGNIREILVLRTSSNDAAREMLAKDDAIRTNVFVPDVHPWFGPTNVMRRPNENEMPRTYFVGLLRRGPRWTPGESPALAKLQEAHLANIRKLAQTGKLVLAGPFEDEGPLRGIFVFKTASIAEPKTLAETDPAVQAGRFVISIHTWVVPNSMLP